MPLHVRQAYHPTLYSCLTPSVPQSPATAKFIAAASSSYKHQFGRSDSFRLALFIRWGRPLHNDSGLRTIRRIQSPHVKREKVSDAKYFELHPEAR
jgi:hypothetical protein